MLKFDDVMNDQRKAIFGQRREIMEAEDLGEIAEDMRHQVVEDLVDHHLPPKSYPDQWQTEALHAAVLERLGMDLPVAQWAAEEGVDQDAIRTRLIEAADKMMAEKLEVFGPATMRNIEKQVLLQSIDGKWREHLVRLEHLRSVVGFRGYAQRDPLNEYKTESFTLFESMLNSLRQDVTQKLAMVRPISADEQRVMMAQLVAQQQGAPEVAAEPAPPAPEPAARPGFDAADPATWGNPARNDACPCGSGEKFKHCHGKLA